MADLGCPLSKGYNCFVLSVSCVHCPVERGPRYDCCLQGIAAMLQVAGPPDDNAKFVSALKKEEENEGSWNKEPRDGCTDGCRTVCCCSSSMYE